MKHISLILFFIIISLIAKCQWKGKNDTSKIVGLICKDKDCSDAKFFRGYIVSYMPSKKELFESNKLNISKDFPEDMFLDEKKKVIDIIPITFYYYGWK